MAKLQWRRSSWVTEFKAKTARLSKACRHGRTWLESASTTTEEDQSSKNNSRKESKERELLKGRRCVRHAQRGIERGKPKRLKTERGSPGKNQKGKIEVHRRISSKKNWAPPKFRRRDFWILPSRYDGLTTETTTKGL